MDYLDRMETNLACHSTYPHARTPGMSVVQRAGCVIADSGLPCGTFNTVFFSGGMWLSTEQFHEVARDIRARFGPFVWWLGPSTIDPGLTSQMEAAGFRYAETEEGMILRLTNGPTLPRPVTRLPQPGSRRPRILSSLPPSLPPTGSPKIATSSNSIGRFSRPCSPLGRCDYSSAIGVESQSEPVRS